MHAYFPEVCSTSDFTDTLPGKRCWKLRDISPVDSATDSASGTVRVSQGSRWTWAFSWAQASWNVDEGEALGYSQTLGELEHPRMNKYEQSEDKVKGEESRPRVHPQTPSHLHTGGWEQEPRIPKWAGVEKRIGKGQRIRNVIFKNPNENRKEETKRKGGNDAQNRIWWGLRNWT